MKRYDQYCPIACSLSLVGERWTLLVVRELMEGPKRYTDLVDGLPGIGTNILAARLKDLESAGIVTKQKLPPPAASTVYELTAAGRSLKPVLHELARGSTYADIAANLFVSENTVKPHVSSLYAKLSVNRRSAALAAARSMNLL